MNPTKASEGGSASTRWILSATILGSSMAFIDGTVTNIALPALQASLGASVVDAQWVVEAYALFLGALILVGGSLGDMLGRRRLFAAGVVAFAGASAWCGFAPDIHSLIAARAVQGIGGALLVPGSLAIIGASFADNERGRAIGTWSGFTSITAAIGPLLGGWLIQHASWRWVFFLNLPIAIVVLIITFKFVPESRNPNAGRLDWAGAFLATAGLGGVVYALIESSRAGWLHPGILAPLAAGVAALIAFPWLEARSQSPMVPLELFRSRTFTGANLLTLFLYAPIGIFFFVFPLDFIQVQGYSATAAGAALLPFILLMFLLSRWSGGLVARYGARLPLTVGPSLVALGYALFALPSLGQSYWSGFFPATLLMGFGMAVSVAPLTTTVMGAVGQERVGTASGINNAVSRIAGLLAVAVLGAALVQVFSARLDRNLAGISLPVSAANEMRSNRIRLAALEVPAGLDPATAARVRTAIQASFIFGFRVTMLISVGLALASAGVTVFTITDERAKPPA